MRKDGNDNLVVELLREYDFRIHNFSRLANYKIDIYCAYQRVRLNTDQDREIIALKFLERTNVPLVSRINQGIFEYVSMYDDLQLYRQISGQINNDYKCNCHGYTFLNGEYWLDDKTELDKILVDDSYIAIEEVDENKDCVVLYDNPTEYAHSLRYNAGNKIFFSKSGLNHLANSTEYETLAANYLNGNDKKIFAKNV
jgi:hypothetical protein